MIARNLRLLTAAACAVFVFIIMSSGANAAINPMISFQGKLTNPDGTNVTDGNYSIRFRIYTDPSADTGACANTCKWEETHGTVAVTGGRFHVNLGDAGTALPGSVDFNGSALYLGIKVSTDAEMTPRVRLTASPYAFNSDKLGGLDASSFVQLSPGSQQTGNINISGTITSGAVNGVTISNTLQPSAAGAMTVQSNGSNALTLTSGAAATWSTTAGVLTVQGFAGITVNTPAASGATSSISILTGNSSAGTAGSVTIDTGTTSTGTPAVNIGNSNARSVQLGNGTGTTTVAVLCGTGACGFGDNAIAHTTTVGSVTGTATTILQAGTGGLSLTSGANITLGVSDTTATLLVLDTKTSAGDPTGVNGSMYYNSNSNKFRCYENGAWKDCDTTAAGAAGVPQPNTRRWTYITYAGSGTTWHAVGNLATATGTGTTQAATATEPARVNYATTTTNGNPGGLSGNTTYRRDRDILFQAYVQPNATTNTRVWIGLTNQTAATMGASANPAGNYAAFRWDTSASDATWKCVTKDNTTQNIQDSGITVTTTGVKLEIVESTSDFVFKINGTTVCTNSTNLPAAGTNMRYIATNATNNGVATNVRYAWIYLESNL